MNRLHLIRRKFECRAVAAAAALSFCAVLQASANERYEGRAFVAGSSELAYLETDWLFDSGGHATRLVLYRCANGEPFARKLVRDGGNVAAPDFDFVDARDGYAEGVRTENGQRTVFVRQRGEDPLQQKTVDIGPDTVVDAGFDALIRERWDRLVGQGSMSGSFLVPGRLDFLPVKITRLGATADGLLHLRLQLDRWYGFALPKMQITYRADDRWLAQFEGIGNIRDASFQHSSVRIEFPESSRSRQVPQSEIEDALKARLTNRCS